MTPRKKAEENSSVEDVAVQSEEAREKTLQRSSAGSLSAIGVEREFRLGDGEDRIKGLESRGVDQEIEGGEPEPDHPPHPGPAARGLQTAPANFVTNGTVPATFVGSPSGPVPVSSVARDAAHARQLLKEARESNDRVVLGAGYEKVSRDKIEKMSGAELRAVAYDRGYDLGQQSGSRSTRRRFIEAQNKDQRLEGVEEGDVADESTATSSEVE